MALPYRSLARRLSLALSAAAWLPGTALAGVVALHQFAATAGGVYKLGATAKDEPIQAPDGSFFLATENGGTAGGCTGGVSGCGVVVQITGTMTKVIYNFPTNDNDLEFPVGALVQGPDGSLYGTTSGEPEPIGTGAVYKLTLQPNGSWAETTLHRFTGGNSCNTPVDGGIPLGRLVFGADGMLYGTTSQGGCVENGPPGEQGPYNNQGTLFRLATDGTNYALLHDFNGEFDHVDAAGPAAGMTLGPQGMLYGTSHFGGSANEGTVFRLDPSTLQVTTLHSFSGVSPDGGTPLGALTLGSDGNLWGTTFTSSDGNDPSHAGTVFKIALPPPHAMASYIFPASGTYSQPEAGVFEAGDGNFYGTTGKGGFYSITQAGVISDLYDFPSVQTVTGPIAMPLQGSNGAIYMTTSNGGPVTNGYTDRGGFFAYSNALAKPKPVIQFFSAKDGAVGSTVVIGGANFVKASKVAFAGVAAGFSVNASGFISAVVPAGAVTGFVKVTTPGGTAVSPVQFAVP